MGDNRGVGRHTRGQPGGRTEPGTAAPPRRRTGRRWAAVVGALLIVGGLDHLVLALNREAQAQLRCDSRLAVVPGASHLFEEPGTLQAAAELARDWFLSHVSSSTWSAA